MPITMSFRGWLYGLAMPKCGKNFQVAADAYIKTLENTYIGNNVFIGNNSILLGHGKIIIEDNVLIAPLCLLTSGNHVLFDGSFQNKKADFGTIHIKKGSWIAANCTITKGAILPNNSVLAANSFLNSHFELNNSVYGGAPARFIKQKKSKTHEG